jgi:hypothetical protein
VPFAFLFSGTPSALDIRRQKSEDKSQNTALDDLPNN